MKQPSALWQVLAMFITVGLFALGGMITASNKISKLEQKITDIQGQLEMTQLNTDKKFDKIDAKIDLIQNDTRQILVNLAGKMDRK